MIGDFVTPTSPTFTAVPGQGDSMAIVIERYPAARDEARVIALVEVLQTIIGPHHPGRRVRSYREGARGGWSEIRAAATRARAGNDWSPPTGLGPQTTQGGTMLCSCRDHDVPAAAAECDACRWQREQRAARLHYRTFRRSRAWHLAGLVARAVMEGKL